MPSSIPRCPHIYNQAWGSAHTLNSTPHCTTSPPAVYQHSQSYRSVLQNKDIFCPAPLGHPHDSKFKKSCYSRCPNFFLLLSSQNLSEILSNIFTTFLAPQTWRRQSESWYSLSFNNNWRPSTWNSNLSLNYSCHLILSLLLASTEAVPAVFASRGAGFAMVPST